MTKNDLPALLGWALRLPVINRLKIARQPQELVRFLKFASLGAFCIVLDLAILNLMYRLVLPPIFPALAANQRLVVANSISFTTAVISNFTWNRLWTFPESREHPVLSQLGQFALVNVIGLGINNLVLVTVRSVISRLIAEPWDYNLAKITAIGVVLFWNYFVNRAWTYRDIE